MIQNIAYGPDTSHVLDLYLPQNKSFDVFLYFHGGGLEGGDKQEGSVLANYLVNKGVAVVSANYRMYPAAKFPEFIEDAAEAVAWVVKNMGKYGDCRRIFVGGSSAGGYLSMMLCFDTRYLKAHSVDPMQISGYFHDAGQPTSHFHVLRERGIDSRRVIVDETAPMYFAGMEENYPPMAFLVSDNDMAGRYAQTMLMLETLKHFGHQEPEITYKVLQGTHCHYVQAVDTEGNSVLGSLIYGFLSSR